MKLWDKGYRIDSAIERFTVGNDRVLDLELARYDVIGSMAHAQMLFEVGLLEAEEAKSLLAELDNILKEIEAGNFVIEDAFEDVHSKVEFMLTQRLGEAGKRIHTGRSRNDQVLLDMHLYMKAIILEYKELIGELFESLMRMSALHAQKPLPGYTHLQVAMPSSFGLWFGAYAESLIDDLHLFRAAYRVVDQNPLGSAAGYGTSLPLNRTRTTELMHFSTLKYNVVAAQMARGKAEKTLSFAMSSVAGTLSRFSMDVCLYMSQNFGFLGLPKELTTGSSIMPHKQNPDVFELIRGKCNRIQALPNEITLVLNNLPSGYHRDFQLFKECLVPAIAQLRDCLALAAYMAEKLIVKEGFMQEEKYRFIDSVDQVNRLVLEQGVPFREAYRMVGEAITTDTYQTGQGAPHTHEGSLGNLCHEEIRAKFHQAWV